MTKLNPAMMVMGWPLGFGAKGLRRDPGGVTADGGRCSPIDYAMDNDGPLPTETAEASDARRSMMAARDKRSAAAKRFQVTPNASQGGSGLYHGSDEDK